MDYQDADGNRYSVASTVVKQAFTDGAGSELVAPGFAPDADLDKARAGQAMLSINDQPAGPDIIAVALGGRLESANEHLQRLGLSLIPDEPEVDDG
ncbi:MULTISPECIES: hypothetical protein [unclassified Halomonas]|uniref:hypothetical protein n=1 Tax=unclassified Halomonas TaxID=2609666 RepID=UPI002076A025|nr:MULTISPECIES: hypothetical protein [unclassified Halomonas]